MLCSLFLGCAFVGEAVPTATPTPNPTLVSISRMLTDTRAAPTITTTPTITPTRAVTPTPTAEIFLPGMRRLPAPGEERFVQNDVAVTILAVQEVKDLDRLKAGEGSAYLDLEVLIENGSAEAYPYNPLDFRLLSGAEELVQPAVDALNPGLLSGDLPPGEWVRGHLAFSITEGTLPGLVRYRPVEKNTWPGETWLDLGGVGSAAPLIPAQPGWPGAGLLTAPGRQEAGGVALTIEKVEMGGRLHRKADKGMHFISLAVKIENLAHDRSPYNPYYFRLKDQRGYEYLPVLGAPDTSLQAGSLGRGQSVRSVVIFEMPETELVLVASYQPTVLVDDYQPVRMVIQLPVLAK